ncbi:putative membrane associated protein (plasmid) [Roseomonas mucosa]|uniref:Putative membrane associated protein n=1 Tax=Roseomonas mucosa TaxID=207340 RepID=A0A4Y1MQU7_9PROT|nr:bifunctional DNA primase/polymerase [Roseomonas mucosa]AWV20346.1 putative membrane associated protein [Roseomonas mucosa]
MTSWKEYLARQKAGARDNPMAEAAVALGLPVFPCGADKKPLTMHGFKDATTDPARIRTMFSNPAAAMIGVPTGEQTGVVVIDVDRKENRQGGQWLDANSHRMPQTRTIRTGSGGLHIYLLHPGQRVKNSNDKIAPGIDVRGDGGYVIVPPSPGYSVADDAPFAEMPDWIVATLCPPEPVATPVPPRAPRTPTSQGGTPYGLKALDDECQAIDRAGFGSQESTLNAAGLKIGALVAGGELEHGPALAALLSSARSMPSQPGKKPWSPQELERKARRAFEDGMRQPRTAPDRPRDEPEVHPAAGFLARIAERAKKRPQQALPVDPGIMDVDGVLKLFIDHCERTAMSSQPFLALAAGITLVGVLAGRRYRTTTDLRTNCPSSEHSAQLAA